MPADIYKIYRTTDGILVETGGRFFVVRNYDWVELFNHADLTGCLVQAIGEGHEIDAPGEEIFLPPVEDQEVWAAGVTYLRSRTARMEEAAAAGGGDFYDRVYDAARPELFLKATSNRVVGQGQDIRIRFDAAWSVPEPELALAVNNRGETIGYTIGNDMSSRDIEGANPLYLPQAKTYKQCCGLGPALVVTNAPLPIETKINIVIDRDGTTVFQGSTNLAAMKRQPEELVEYLLRDNDFPNGCYLLTGTGVVPPDSFTLERGDWIKIDIDSLGVLENHVIQG